MYDHDPFISRKVIVPRGYLRQRHRPNGWICVHDHIGTGLFFLPKRVASYDRNDDKECTGKKVHFARNIDSACGYP